ncbi:thiol reductant ABC exporter subunit CydD [Nocardia sp. ET3-3]|uniref:Thiol reductant ABC exporter subunit CydD n=1 Tax=Nocardia terrae TaxID=2675851 RepID=A0A7K1UYH4_9NOCA|nr:thiol reductant ABC exporter subunit CydD [Nocardia terrae]
MARPVDPRLWRHARSARRYLGLSVGLSLVTTGCIVIAALALARVLAGVITEPEHRRIGSWTVELVIFAVAVGCRVAATWWQSRLAHRAGAQVVAELETAALDAGAQLPPRELESRRTELAVVVGSGLSGLRAYLAGYLPALILATLVPPVVLAVIAAHDWISGVIILVTLPLIPIFMILIGLLTQGKSADTLAATTRLSDQLLDLFAGMPTLRALGRETGRADAAAVGDSPRSMAGRVRELGDVLHRRTMSALRLAFLSSMVLEMLATLCVALVAVSIGMRLVFGHMGLYAGLLALILAPEVYLPLRAVGERFHAAQDGMAAAERAFAIIEPDADPAASAAPADPNRAGHRNIHGHIDIRNLTIRSRDGYAPDRLSADIRPGLVTVLTGPNGCGKSTALQAILGLLTPDSGTVLVDDAPVPDLDLDDWWSHIAWLPQRPVLVPGTLRANLELLGPPAGPAQIESACVATGFDTVLRDLPDRWDTIVGTGGLGLSLGQRQRLALTRTLAAPRSILLLDEPTAHLDDASEATVLAALTARARAGATVVVIAHRPSVLAVADHIVEVHATARSASIDSESVHESGIHARTAEPRRTLRDAADAYRGGPPDSAADPSGEAAPGRGDGGDAVLELPRADTACPVGIWGPAGASQGRPLVGDGARTASALTAEQEVAAPDPTGGETAAMGDIPDGAMSARVEHHGARSGDSADHAVGEFDSAEVSAR